MTQLNQLVVDDMALRAKLYTKIAKAASAVTHIPKSGHNKEQKYDFATDADVSHAVRTACLDAGVLVMMVRAERIDSVEITSKSGTKGERVTVLVSVQFHDIETGVFVAVKSIGSGFDYGDKAVAKAITSAVKYALLKGLCLPTGDDPEGDEETDRNPATTAPTKVSTKLPPGEADREVASPKPAPRPDHHALAKFLADHKIPRDSFLRVCTEGLHWPAGQTPKVTDLNPAQVEAVTRILQREIDSDAMDEAPL